MYSLAKARTALNQRDEHETVLIGLIMATNVLRDHVRSGMLVLSSVIALSASAFAQAPAASAVGQADLDTLGRDPNQWVMAPHDYASTRFSGLDQINVGNATQLALPVPWRVIVTLALKTARWPLPTGFAGGKAT